MFKMKNLKFKTPDFIKELIISFGIFMVLYILNLFTFRIFPPILYACFWIIYFFRIRKYWLWAFKLEYIINYVRGLLDFRLMIGFGLIYFCLVPIPLMLLSLILPMLVWALFHDFIPRIIVQVLIDDLPRLAFWVVILMVVFGFIMKFIRFLNKGSLNKGTEDNKNDSTDKRLIKIKQLLDDNIISKEEYEEQRRKIIGDV